MSPTYRLDKDKNSKSIDQKLYRDIIGFLLYLTTSRLDVLFGVCMYARFQSNPKEFHLIAVERILRYLVNV